MQKKIKYSVLILIFMVLIFNCKKEDQSVKKENVVKSIDNVETIFAVNTTTAIKGEINDYIELNGDIKSKNQVDVYPDVMGKLVKIKNIGEYINKGEVIAEVDQSKPGLTYEVSRVLAPISGTIMEVSYQVGSTVSPQTSLAKIGLLNQIEITTNVSEKFISKTKTGLSCLIGIEAFPDIQFHGFVSSLSPVVDPQTRMMEVKILMNEIDGRIKPGMFTRVKIITEKKDNIVKVPVECVVKRFAEDYVFVVNQKIPVIIKGDILKDRIIKDLSLEETIFVLDICGIKIDTKSIDPQQLKSEKEKKDADMKKILLLIDSKTDYQIKNNLSKDDSDRLWKIFNSSGFFTVEKRKIKQGIQIDDKVEITEGLYSGEEIVIRGQTLLEDKTRIKVIDKIEPLSKKDVIK